MQRVSDLGGFNKLVHGRDGFFVANENDMYVGQAMIKYGEYSQQEMDLFRQLVQPGDVIAEIGANIGTHTVGLAKLAGPTGRVLAFEPQPVIFQNLCANLSLNSLTNVDTYHCGLGATASTIRVPYYRYDQHANFAGLAIDPEAEQGTPVEVKTFDDVFKYTRLKLMKVDVEGMEADVLQGARASIARFKPALYVENDRGDRSESLIQLVMDMGYRLWWHVPPLFNPDNYFGDAENIFTGLASLNMLCLHREVPANLTNFTEITEPTVHPILAGGSTES